MTRSSGSIRGAAGKNRVRPEFRRFPAKNRTPAWCPPRPRGSRFTGKRSCGLCCLGDARLVPGRFHPSACFWPSRLPSRSSANNSPVPPSPSIRSLPRPLPVRPHRYPPVAPTRCPKGVIRYPADYPPSPRFRRGNPDSSGTTDGRTSAVPEHTPGRSSPSTPWMVSPAM